MTYVIVCIVDQRIADVKKNDQIPKMSTKSVYSVNKIWIWLLGFILLLLLLVQALMAIYSQQSILTLTKVGLQRFEKPSQAVYPVATSISSDPFDHVVRPPGFEDPDDWADLVQA